MNSRPGFATRASWWTRVSGTVLAGATLLPATLAAQGTPRSSGSGFGPQHIISQEALGALEVFAADVDGDGDQDVLSAYALDDEPTWWYEKAEIGWYENHGGVGTFGGPHAIATGLPYPALLVPTDLDGDGDVDVLCIPGEDKIVWYENQDGLGTFGPQLPVVISTSVYPMAAADLDGDGDEDVFYRTDQSIAWCANVDGLGSLGPPRVIATGAGDVRSLTAEDIDGDGDQDVLAALGYDDIVAWYENLDGRGNYGPLRTIASSASCAQSVVGADLDGDGDLDVLAACEGCAWDPEVSWYENTDGLGSFGPPQIIARPLFPVKVVASDLDGDGDVVWSTYDPSEIRWQENLDGQGSFGPARLITDEIWQQPSLQCADLDGDGDPDVLSSSWADDKLAWYENSPATAAFRNDAAGTNPTGYAASVPLLGEDWIATVNNTGSGNLLAGILGFADPQEVYLPGTDDFLLVDPLSPGGELLQLAPGYGYGVVTFVVPIPDDPILAGFAFSTQGGGLGGSSGANLHNAYDLTVGY